MPYCKKFTGGYNCGESILTDFFFLVSATLLVKKIGGEFSDILIFALYSANTGLFRLRISNFGIKF